MKRNLILLFIVGTMLIGCSSLENRYSQPSKTPSPTLSVSPSRLPTFTVTVFPYETYTVTTDLEKRACPSVSCANVGYYYEGDIILVEGWLNDPSLPECQSWAHIANEAYWVCAEYVMAK